MLKRLLIIIVLLISCTTHAAPTIVVLGDSLSASYGIDHNDGWVALLAQRLKKTNKTFQVINASISGETSAGGLQRINDIIKQHRPSILIIELGANDGLRGLPLKQLHSNLTQIIQHSQNNNISILLIGMRLPNNYGAGYSDRFSAVFQKLAEQNKLPLVPFLLAGLENNRAMFQKDGLHPIAAAQPVILNNVWPQLKLLLD